MNEEHHSVFYISNGHFTHKPKEKRQLANMAISPSNHFENVSIQKSFSNTTNTLTIAIDSKFVPPQLLSSFTSFAFVIIFN